MIEYNSPYTHSDKTSGITNISISHTISNQTIKIYNQSNLSISFTRCNRIFDSSQSNLEFLTAIEWWHSKGLFDAKTNSKVDSGAILHKIWMGILEYQMNIIIISVYDVLLV